jgi:hypothetical protein
MSSAGSESESESLSSVAVTTVKAKKPVKRERMVLRPRSSRSPRQMKVLCIGSEEAEVDNDLVDDPGDGEPDDGEDLEVPNSEDEREEEELQAAIEQIEQAHDSDYGSSGHSQTVVTKTVSEWRGRSNNSSDVSVGESESEFSETMAKFVAADDEPEESSVHSSSVSASFSSSERGD